MSAHTPAEQACFDALVEHNKPITHDDLPYPSCLWPIAEAATKAVLDATTTPKKCTHPNRYQTEAEESCLDCGASS